MSDTDTAAMRPPLTGWSHAWRLLAMLVVSAGAWSQVVADQWRDERALFWLDLGLGLVAYAVVHLRAHARFGVAVALVLMSTVSSVAGGPAVLAIVSVAIGRQLGQVATLGILNVAAFLIYLTIQPNSPGDAWWGDAIGAAAFTAAAIGWGLYLGSRRELLWSLRDRAHRAEQEQTLRADQARLAERARIAREMHDVLGHRISQMSMQAGALSFRSDLSADELRAGASDIRDRAQEALTDLRGVLGVLRDERTGEPLNAPQPKYADIAPLVEEVRSMGDNVELEDHLPMETPVPDPVGRTLFRVVQEGITNVRKHSPGALLSIRFDGSLDEGVTFRLSNPLGFHHGPQVVSGLGLIGLGERVALRGGSIESGRQGDLFVLSGWLPWAS